MNLQLQSAIYYFSRDSAQSNMTWIFKEMTLFHRKVGLSQASQPTGTLRGSLWQLVGIGDRYLLPSYGIAAGLQLETTAQEDSQMNND